MKNKWIIQDWTGKTCFHGKSFKSFDDADCFLTEFIEKTYPDTVENDERYSEERGEYYIDEVNK
jgi:hypothetical protein